MRNCDLSNSKNQSSFQSEPQINANEAALPAERCDSTMTINYKIEQNHLNTATTPFKGRIVSAKTIKLDDLIDGIIQNAGTTVSRSDIAAVFADLKALVRSFLLMGHRVHLDG